ncbi:MAG: hypothetical protein WC737_05560 [Parcubacteria group bacterium]|jgi:hypothetical protein
MTKQEILLYSGAIKLFFIDKPKKRGYYRSNGDKIISVTEALSIINKPILNEWRLKVMRDRLIEIGQTRQITNGDIYEASGKSDEIKIEAANIGKDIHHWIESYINFKIKKAKKRPSLPDDEKILNGAMAFLGWEREHRVEWIASEKFIYSKKHIYAGTLDAIAIVDGLRCVIDFKTGNAIYNEMRYQTAAYQNADEEETGIKYDGPRWILRFDKFTAEFEDTEVPVKDYKADLEAFLAALTLKKREVTLNNKQKKEVILPY